LKRESKVLEIVRREAIGVGGLNVWLELGGLLIGGATLCGKGYLVPHFFTHRHLGHSVNLTLFLRFALMSSNVHEVGRMEVEKLVLFGLVVAGQHQLLDGQ